MRRAEARDLVRAAAGGARAVAEVADTTATATSDLVYAPLRRLLGPAVTPVRVTHQLIGKGVALGVQAGLAAGGHAGAAAVAVLASDEGASLHDRPGAGAALGVLNGIAGDRLAAQDSTLALGMSLRHAGRELAITPEALRAAYPTGGRRLVVLVHGLVETEQAWRFRARQRWGDEQVDYGGLLDRELGWRALYLRYNTGLPVATNAALLGDLLADLVPVWPDPVEEIALVGHSMGGLVALTALAHDGRDWTSRVRTVVTLGSPRDGAPLERAAAVVEEFTERTGWGRWVGGLVGWRSGGIRDLHDPLAHPPIPDRIAQYAVLATLTPDSWHPRVARVGDGLVPLPERPHCRTAVIAGAHHLDLLNHPEVYALLREWLGPVEG